jgi:phage baseplate assembly protein W
VHGGGPAKVPDGREVDTVTADAAAKILRSDFGLIVSLDDNAQTITSRISCGINLMTVKVSEGTIEIRSAVQIVLEAPLIKHGQNATHPAVFGDQLLTYLNHSSRCSTPTCIRASSRRASSRSRRRRRSAFPPATRPDLDQEPRGVGAQWLDQLTGGGTVFASERTAWPRRSERPSSTGCSSTHRSIRSVRGSPEPPDATLFAAIAPRGDRAPRRKPRRAEDRHHERAAAATRAEQYHGRVVIHGDGHQLMAIEHPAPRRPVPPDRRRRTATTGEDDHVRDMIFSVLFTDPRERVTTHTRLRCGLKTLVLRASQPGARRRARRCSSRASLQRWLEEEIEVADVEVEAIENELTVTVAYRRRAESELRVERFGLVQ